MADHDSKSLNNSDQNSQGAASRVKLLLLPFLALRWLIHKILGGLKGIGRGIGAMAGYVCRYPTHAVVCMTILAAMIAVWGLWEAQPKLPELTVLALRETQSKHPEPSKPPEPVEVTFTVNDPESTHYGYDQPVVTPLRISFSTEVAVLGSIDKEVASENITISPPLVGKWKWESDMVLAFLPETDWPIDSEHTVKFSPEMFRQEAHFDSYKTAFQTPHFRAQSLGARFDQNPVDPEDMRVSASINFTHPVDTSDFEKRVSMVVEGQKTGMFGLGGEKKVAIEVSFDEKKLNAYIHSAKLPVPDSGQTVRVTVDKGVRAAAGGNKTDGVLTATAFIPALDGLEVSNVELAAVINSKYQPEQVLMLELSMPVQRQKAKDIVKVWLLPKLPPEGDPRREVMETDQMYNWDIGSIDQDLLKVSEVLKPETLPGLSDGEVIHAFNYRYQAPPGRYIYVQVPKGLKAFGGHHLPNDVEHVFQIPSFPPVVQIIAQGSLLSLSGERKLSVMARDVPAIRYSISRVVPQQLQYLVNKAIRHSSDFSNPSLDNQYGNVNELDIAERFEKVVELPKLEAGKTQYQALDLTEYLGEAGKVRRGVFLLRVQGFDSKAKQVVWYGGDEEEGRLVEDGRLVIVSDLGLIEKKNVDGSHDLFVQSIHRGGPVAGAVIEVIGRNGLPVLQTKTDSRGHATFPKLDDFQFEREPILFMVSKDGDSNFLPYSRHNKFGRNLNYSRFDIGGAVNAASNRQLSAYLFSDRGIYRPGEEIRVGMIVRQTDWTQSVAGIPLELEVIDARGLTVRRDKITLPKEGFGEISHAVLDTAPAGTYTINLSLVKNDHADTLIGSTTVRVQDFEPDRLRMNVRFNQEKTDGWVAPDDLGVEVSLQNLFATPAENRRVRGFLSLTPGVLQFPRYKDYLFDDPQRAKNQVSEELAEATTNEEGMATLDLDLQRFARATYRAHVVVQGFEADGGRGVSAEATVLVSGLDYLVGYKPDGKLNYVRLDSARTVNLLAIGRDGKQRMVEGLTLRRIEHRYVSELTKQDNGTYRYQSKEKEILHEEKPLSIAAAGHSLKLATGTPGTFTYVVYAGDVEYARIAYNVAGDADLTRSLDKNAELKLTLSKADFVPGEEIEVQIEAPYTGHGLITIERGRVYAHRWFSSTTTSTIQKIRLPKDVDGNAYLTVTFVRDPGSDEIYMSPLSYGVVPFSVSREHFQLKLDVAAPDKIKPGETATFKVKSDKAAKVVVFAIDEGVLQVARYKTADPLGYFFQKRALEVTTSQLLDLILPEFSRLMASAPGGDGEAAQGRFLNPFKRKRDQAVAYWSGIVDVGPDGKTLSWQVPESFNGKLRVMAVAVTPQTVGVYEGQTIVRGDFVLSPNAPLTVTPGDEFDMSVGVSNNLESSGSKAKVKVTLNGGEHFEVLGKKTIEVPIPANREGVVHFLVRAKPRLGSGTLALTASIGGKKTSLATTVSIRPATPHHQELQVGMVGIGEKIEIPITRRRHAEHRKLNIDVSPSPQAVNSGLVSYLGDFPYSCTEQLVSKAIPALVLSHRPEFGEIKKERGATLAGLIAVLRGRQNAEGAYGLWAADSYVSEPASVWVQQFLVEAKDRGETVPVDMLRRGNEWLHNYAAREGHSFGDDRTRAQAVYILTRQGVQTSTLATAIQERLERRNAKHWRNDLTAMYLAATYKLLKQDQLAERALSDFLFTDAEEKDGVAGANNPLGDARDNERWLYDSLRRDASALHLLALHFPERARKLQEGAFTLMLSALSESGNTSFSSGQLLLALDAWTSLAKTSGGAKFSVDEIMADKTTRARPLSSGVVQRTAISPEAVEVVIRNRGDTMGFYVVEMAGFDIDPPKSELREGVEILREYTDASGIRMTSVEQGDEVYVRLKLRGLNGAYSGINLAVVDLLPGGFDLVLNPPSEEANESQQALRRDSPSEDEYEDESEPDSERRGSWQAPFGNSPTNWVQYADMREDRIVLYGILEAELTEFVYKIRATNVGTYSLPPAYAEGLYRRTVRAHSLPGGKITVVAPSAKR